MNKNLKTVVESLHREIDIYQSQLLKPHAIWRKKSRKNQGENQGKNQEEK